MQKMGAFFWVGLVAKGVAAATAYVAVVAGLMYPVLQAAGYLG